MHQKKIQIWSEEKKNSERVFFKAFFSDETHTD
jgi:hypothetical protein